MRPDALLDSPGFRFVAACCLWPRTETALQTVRETAAQITDWADAGRLVVRHRVAGLVQDAVLASGVAPPGELRAHLIRAAERIRLSAERHAWETARLQAALDAADLPAMTLKGAPVGVLAYGAAPVKFAKDIDLLVPPDRAWEARTLLCDLGYRPLPFAAKLDERQFRNVVRYDKDTPLFHPQRGIEVELHWRAVHNARLLRGLDATTPGQDVALPQGGRARTFNNADLLAYLSVHGALHAWFRLKWIADFSALVSGCSDDQILDAYRRAEARGAGLCFLQGLAVRRRVLGLAPPAALAGAASAPRIARLTRTVAENLTGPTPYDPDLTTAQKLRRQIAQFRLGRGLRFVWAQARLTLVGVPDLYAFPLPPRLGWLYVPLRAPFLVIRRLRGPSGPDAPPPR